MRRKILIYFTSVMGLTLGYSILVIRDVISRLDMYNWLVFLYLVILVLFVLLFRFKNYFQAIFGGVLLLCNIGLSLTCSIYYTKHLNEYRFNLNTDKLDTFVRYGLIAVISSALVIVCSYIPHKIVGLVLQVGIYLVAITYMVLSIQHMLLIEY